MPTVSGTAASIATLSLVPTPSVPETRIGIGETRRLEVEQAAEAAQSAHDAGTVGALRQRLDVLDEVVARIDVDAGVLVGEGGPIVARGVRLQAGLIHAR